LRRRRTAAGPALAAAALLSSPLAGGAPAADAPPRVRPGTVVRWPGDGIEWCEGLGRRSEPLEGACYFPVDLLHKPGPLELERRRAGKLERLSARVSRFDYPVQKLTLPSRMVDLSAADLERVRRENREVARLWGTAAPRRFRLPLAAPLDPLPAGGRFGHRRVINGTPRSPHGGADYSADLGTPVRSAADGRVVMVADHFFAGNAVFVDHGDGLVTQYFHLSRVDVRQGQQVARGERVGEVGATGRASGPHLHFGVRWRGARVDPDALVASPGELPCLAPAPGLGCR
jgi:murein DD-endopeptidase MepM/ murein hydrolase activator NlpD